MKKTIQKSMMLLVFCSITLFALFLSLVFYQALSSQVENTVGLEARAMAEQIDGGTLAPKDFLHHAGYRYTLVDPDGTVVFDSVAPPETMENHLDRVEIQEAITTGYGRSRRFSSTLQNENFYAAIKLTNGQILRVAQSSSSVYGVLASGILPMMGMMSLVFLCSRFAAKGLTKEILKPLNQLDLDSDLRLYTASEELTPFVRRISQQKEQIASQTAELRRQIETTNAILENMREGLILIDRDGSLILINATAQKLLQVNNPTTGAPVVQLTRQQDLLNYVEKALGGKQGEDHLVFREKTYRTIFNPIEGGGCVVLLIDITKQLKAEKIRQEFSANVSHELKTPLAAISGYAEMISTDMVLEKDIPLFIGKIRIEAARLQSLIEDIMKISELDESGQDDPLEQVELLALARQVGGDLQGKAEMQGVTIDVQGEEVEIWGKRNHFAEILINLIDNAIKYNRPGGSVFVQIENRQHTAVITVLDTGIGIPEEYQAQVFHRFFRVDPSRSKKTGGTGLGLSILKHIVGRYGGQIALTSQLGEGTKVKVYLPDGEKGSGDKERKQN